MADKVNNEFTSETPGHIGEGIRIRGRLRGAEDLVIEGAVEGTISLTENHLILERSATIEANVDVKKITVRGAITGNTVASERVEITDAAWVKGDIKAPRLVVQEGAKFKGAVDMEVPLPQGLLGD